MFEYLQFIGIILVALLPVLGWLWFFQKKQPEKKSYLALTFLAGMLSILPIKLYEAYWDIAILNLENLSLFTAIANLVHVQSLPKLFSFIILNVIVAFGLFIFVAFLMFFLEILSGDNTMKTFRRKFIRIMESPVFFVSVGIILGLYTYFSSFSLHEKIYFFLVVGMLEEFVKNLVLRFADEFKINSVDDALEFSIVVALGFAFAENVLYFNNLIGGGQVLGQSIYILIIMRSTISVAAHVIFSSIFGYFYGIAYFASDIYKEKIKGAQGFVIRRLHQILHLKEVTLFHEEQLFLGMFLAMGLHAIYNSLLEFNKFNFALIFICVFIIIIQHLFHKQKFAIIKRN